MHESKPSASPLDAPFDDRADAQHSANEAELSYEMVDALNEQFKPRGPTRVVSAL